MILELRSPSGSASDPFVHFQPHIRSTHMSTFDPFRVLPGSHRQEFAGTPFGRPAAKESVQVVLHLRRKQKLHVESVISTRFILPSVLETQFGMDEEDLAAVLEFAHDHGLWVDQIERDKRLVTVHATAGVVEQAFKTSLELRKHNGRVHRVRYGPIFLPHSLIGRVTGVFGIDNRPQAIPHLVRSKLSAKSIFKPAAFDGNQLASLYDFPQATANGAGQTIALIELGGGVFQPDLFVFFKSLGLPMPVVKHVSVNGASNQPGLDPGADAEVTLDVEVAGAVVPNASIIIYHSTNDDTGFLQAVLAAIHDDVNKPTIISISWGQAERAWTPQMLSAMSEAFESAAAMGISVLVAAGDDGVNDNQNDGHAHVDFPASSPYVTACGGTTLVVSSDSRQETAWNDGNGSATGGGISDFFSRPTYQTSTPMPANLSSDNLGRGLPDVSAVADPNTGYAVFLHGGWQIFGGTSAVAPLLSGLIARFAQQLGQPIGLFNNFIYSHAANELFNDITVGNNSCDGVAGYAATTGWDAVTGWGSPKGNALLKLLFQARSQQPPIA